MARELTVDLRALRATVIADLPWRSDTKVWGTLSIRGGALRLAPREATSRSIDIPLSSIARATVESTFGVLPALHVWHTIEGREYRSRFEFASGESEPDEGDSGPGIAEHLAPGVAREAAQRLEGGFRVLSGGLNLGKRAARQAVDGRARQEEFRAWPVAIAQAQADLGTRDGPASARDAGPSWSSVVPPGARPPSGDAAIIFHWFCTDVIDWLARCGEWARELGVRGIPVIQALHPLDSPVCRIVVAGEFSRGKSTMINALFGIHGEIALPTGMTPTTPIACAIRVPSVGETDGATISYRTKRDSLSLTLEEFRQGVRVAEEGGRLGEGMPAAHDLHIDEAVRVEVRVTGAYLPSGVEIEDTPGLNEQAGRSRGALAAMGRADLILFVLAADQLLGDVERNVIEHDLAEGFHRNVLFLVNFWDSIDDESQRAVLQNRAETVLRAFPSSFRNSSDASLQDVFYVSALQAVRAQRLHKAAPGESGIPQLRARLRLLLGPESQALLLRARVGRALRFAQILRHAVSKTSAALSTGSPVDSPSGASRTTGNEQAIAAAIRMVDGLRGAVEGATARLRVALEEGSAPRLQVLQAMLDQSSEDGSGAAASGPEMKRAVTAEVRGIAADMVRVAQDGVDLIVAEARAEFMTRGLPAPLLDARIEPFAVSVPAEVSLDDLRSLVRNLPQRLREDVDQQSLDVAARLVDMIRGLGRSATPPTAPRPERSAGAPDADGLRKLAALRGVEDDLIRLEGFLLPLLSP